VKMSEQEEMSVMLGDQLRLLEALYEIMMSSGEAEMVRVAASAMTSTQAGLSFLNTHPITL
jgi:hypothetical protein